MDELQQFKDELQKLMKSESIIDKMKIDDIAENIFHSGRMKGISQISLEINEIVCRNLKPKDLISGN